MLQVSASATWWSRLDHAWSTTSMHARTWATCTDVRSRRSAPTQSTASFGTV